MRYTWDEAKRIANLGDHGIDFVDAEKVFAGLTFTYEDDRFPYGERRFVTLGLLAAIPVSMVHTEGDDNIHVISFRIATRYETELLVSQTKDALPPAPKPRRHTHTRHRRTPGGTPNTQRKAHRPTQPNGRL